MKTVLASIGLLVTLVAIGCGGDSEAATPPDAVVRNYHAAIADGDGGKACAQLDTAAQKQLQDQTQGAARASCSQVIELLSAFYDGATKKALRAAKVTVETDGDTGTARFTAPLGLGGPPQEQSYELRRSSGDWKIAKLQFAGG